MSLFVSKKTSAGVIGSLLLLLFAGCVPEKFSIPDKVLPCDEKKAEFYVVKSVSFGDRYSGSKAVRAYGNWIIKTLKEIPGAIVTTEEFTGMTPEGVLPFRNIICEIPGRNPGYVIVGAHYDTKRFSSFSFPGANDGASGVSALLLIAENISKSGVKLPYTLRLVFFDGEECLVEYGENDGLHGSKYHAENLHRSKSSCKAMILLDMIGDKDLCITPPRNSHPKLVSLLEKSAAYLKKSSFTGRFAGEMLDDHVPFIQKGIPSIDLIDFSYGPENVFWHTPEDSPERISGKSIALAADLTIGMLFNIKKEGL